MPISKDRILYADDAILAVDKLAGELVVKGAGKLQKLPLYDFLKKEYPGIHPLNRLDFETSGIVIFARSKKVLGDVLAAKFTGWKKTYRTIVMGRVQKDKGEISIPLPARNKREGNVPALTRYKVLERYANSSYVEIEIMTGRHHQIRRHFSMLKHPLILDEVYGNERFNKTFTREFHYRRFFLHAAKLTFPHPVTKQELTVEALMPKPFEEVLKELRKDY
ncbi:hypothetical protein EXS70_03220 [Candidatus Peribacteria bacterium]|nr:hypothetical protein [Candidatus Peribacteria bacterium]